MAQWDSNLQHKDDRYAVSLDRDGQNYCANASKPSATLNFDAHGHVEDHSIL